MRRVSWVDAFGMALFLGMVWCNIRFGAEKYPGLESVPVWTGFALSAILTVLFTRHLMRRTP